MLLTSGRAVFRLYSRFGSYAVSTGDSTVASDVPRAPMRVTWAPGDSLSAFRDWAAAIGVTTASVSSSDFDDLAPDAWKHTGSPRFDLMAANPNQILRYDRVEVVYTGPAEALRFRSAAPGLTMRAFGGWAWTERTARGGASSPRHRA